ncbi:hypothetical protein Pcinc_011705 [Petrolisthes cinctipes]|uniref:Uncharacterized protein n=1 Tax=Petrolisthes cinctipes TaxID=88211 RepID=A0AAE1G0E7_PETCI|nr:hypothetical protein Pcinc_011705 [Petrolisthes cinctipes]
MFGGGVGVAGCVRDQSWGRDASTPRPPTPPPPPPHSLLSSPLILLSPHSLSPLILPSLSPLFIPTLSPLPLPPCLPSSFPPCLPSSFPPCLPSLSLPVPLLPSTTTRRVGLSGPVRM